MEPCSIFDERAVDRVRDELRFEPGDLRRLRTRFFKKFADPGAALEALETNVREDFASRVRFSELSLDRRHDSSIDGATRLVFKTRSGFSIETVILRAGTGRVSLCVSSQVGCAAKCQFCATGSMGVASSLQSAEILDQVIQANRLLRAEDRGIRNIVFMGMGEPFHNEEGIHEALGSLTGARQFHHPASRILVSTVGIPDAMIRFAKAFPGVNYALSLHAADQGVREQLIPLARLYPLDDLRSAVATLNHIQPRSRTVMLEYLMLSGVNDTPGHIDALIDWCRGLRIHVNLIPYNRIEDAPTLDSSPRQVIEAMGARIRNAGIPTTIRYSMGGDIAAACGQLVRRENQQVARERAIAASGPSS